MLDQEQKPLSATQRALIAIDQLQAKLRQLEYERSEPIAICGVGLRLPGGVEETSRYWELLARGEDAVREVPLERYDPAPFYSSSPDDAGKSVSKWGGFLGDVARFDARFFDVVPAVAVSLDPQQRLALEVSYEALEHAGWCLPELRGKAIGVFVGVASSDYAWRQVPHSESLDAYSAQGTAHSMVPGRIAYFLGVNGPCISVDTACSSSLVALHLAVQSLRRRECERALVGGVNLILSPLGGIGFSKAGLLSPHGRCASFDRSADGFVRAEACSFIALRRLSEAVADGDRVLAILRGTATNQDGRSSGVTAPNGTAQRAVITAALNDAGIRASDVGYVEGHGTGTQLGDAVELDALCDVFGRPAGAPDAACFLGSVKANIGHSEAASGLAGLIKAVLCLAQQQIPPQPHFSACNEGSKLEGSRLSISRSLLACQAPLRFAGVSAFGFNGTNAHVVVERAPLAAESPSVSCGASAWLLPFSGHSRVALAANITALARALERPDAKAASVPELAYALSLKRSHHRVRRAVVVRADADLPATLLALAREVESAAPAQPKAPPGWVFGTLRGQAQAWLSSLQAELPSARAVLDAVDALLAARTGKRLAQLLAGSSDTSPRDVDLYLHATLVLVLKGLGLRPSSLRAAHGAPALAALAMGEATLPDALFACERVSAPALGVNALPWSDEDLETEREAAAHSAVAFGEAGAFGAACALRASVEEGAYPALLSVVAAHYEHGSDVHWRALLPARERWLDLPFYRFQGERHWLVERHAQQPAACAPPAEAVVERFDLSLASFPSAYERERWLVQRLVEEVAQVTGLVPSDVGIDTPLLELGLDSLMIARLRRRLVARVGVDLPFTSLWAHPTLAALAPEVLRQVERAGGEQRTVLPRGPRRNHSLRSSPGTLADQDVRAALLLELADWDQQHHGEPL